MASDFLLLTSGAPDNLLLATGFDLLLASSVPVTHVEAPTVRTLTVAAETRTYTVKDTTP